MHGPASPLPADALDPGRPVAHSEPEGRGQFQANQLQPCGCHWARLHYHFRDCELECGAATDRVLQEEPELRYASCLRADARAIPGSLPNVAQCAHHAPGTQQSPSMNSIYVERVAMKDDSSSASLERYLPWNNPFRRRLKAGRKWQGCLRYRPPILSGLSIDSTP